VVLGFAASAPTTCQVTPAEQGLYQETKRETFLTGSSNCLVSVEENRSEESKFLKITQNFLLV